LSLRLTVLAGLLAVGAGLACAMDVDGELMRGIDETVKSLDSDLAGKEAKAASAEARQLAETFAKVESHYAEQAQTADAAGFAHRAQTYAADTLKAIDAGDFDAAAQALDKLAHSCKSCHAVYKKS